MVKCTLKLKNQTYVGNHTANSSLIGEVESKELVADIMCCGGVIEFRPSPYEYSKKKSSSTLYIHSDNVLYAEFPD